MANAIPVILDTDIGSDIDDTWALLMLLNSPELDIKLIVSCTGDTRFRAAVVAKFLDRVGRSQIPIGVGPATDVGPSHQAAWLDGYELSDYPGTVYEDGVGAMIDTIVSAPEQITLLGIGPLTNIAMALQREPAIAKNAKFVGMTGAVYRGYRDSEEVHAEYNVVRDIPAAKRVFEAKWPKVITPLDTCGVIRLEGDDYAAVVSVVNDGVVALMENYRAWLAAINKDRSIADEKSSVLFDTVAVYLGWTEDLLEMEDLKLLVDDDGYTRINAGGADVRVAVRWRDLTAFKALLIERLTGKNLHA